MGIFWCQDCTSIITTRWYLDRWKWLCPGTNVSATTCCKVDILLKSNIISSNNLFCRLPLLEPNKFLPLRPLLLCFADRTKWQRFDSIYSLVIFSYFYFIVSIIGINVCVSCMLLLYNHVVPERYVNSRMTQNALSFYFIFYLHASNCNFWLPSSIFEIVWHLLSLLFVWGSFHCNASRAFS